MWLAQGRSQRMTKLHPSHRSQTSHPQKARRGQERLACGHGFLPCHPQGQSQFRGSVANDRRPPLRPWRRWPRLAHHGCRATPPAAAHATHQRGPGAGSYRRNRHLAAQQEADFENPTHPANTPTRPRPGQAPRARQRGRATAWPAQSDQAPYWQARCLPPGPGQGHTTPKSGARAPKPCRPSGQQE